VGSFSEWNSCKVGWSVSKQNSLTILVKMLLIFVLILDGLDFAGMVNCTAGDSGKNEIPGIFVQK
jgi:hypothetical protein